MPVRYHIKLLTQDRDKLLSVVKQTKIAQHKKIHAQILLALDENGPALSENQASQMLGVSVKTIQRTRKRCVVEGLKTAVNSKFNGIGRKRKLDGELQASLIALTCSEPPDGRSRWTLQLLADRMVELNYVESITAQTIHRELKKMN